tara:strand:- start:118 stop:840 length:723 start_codon:yes stop_codon:yes gene_type:complete
MNKGIVISLYDYTGEALKPWAKNGYDCYAFDIQHTDLGAMEWFYDENHVLGSISYLYADLHDFNSHKAIFNMFNHKRVVFGMAFPVCTDLAVSGAAWFKRKEAANPGFQDKAVQHAIDCEHLFWHFDCPYFIENPVSVLATKWRKPDYSFHPYEYGEYIPDDEAAHPRWPHYIAPKDAYTKKTCLWTSHSFRMPHRLPTCKPNGYSAQHLKLGGKSKRTKDIRSATPRGFATAVYEFNRA